MQRKENIIVIAKETYCIIPDNKKIATEIKIENLKAVVLVNLFYEEQIDFYRKYLDEIPASIDIIIISSKDVILNRFTSNRYQKIKKDNRGRDISALLVAAKSIVFQYEYICFIHDKKEKEPKRKEYVDLWKKNLWDNMLQSSCYIYNLLELLASTPEIGILVPLPPYVKGRELRWSNLWGDNFANVSRLADELGIRGNVSYGNPPITYSTVFWAKSQALKKLFSKDWEYTDFPAEPMRDDGEINHAIERILEYVVKDAGYEIKIALSASYAAFFMEQLDEGVNRVWDFIEREMGIRNLNDLSHYSVTVRTIWNFAKGHNGFYLYGGGQRGKACLAVCRLLEIVPKGVIVTNIEDGHCEIDGIPISAISDVSLDNNVGVIITVGIGFQKEIEDELEKRNFKEYIVF